MNEYVVYTITLQGKVMYVGKTRNFNNRISIHKTTIGTSRSAIPVGTDLSLITFKVVTECNNNTDALKEENRLIQEYNTREDGWNIRRSGMVYGTKEYKNMYHKMWRDKNRDKLNEIRREYHTENREKENKRNLEYYYKNKVKNA